MGNASGMTSMNRPQTKGWLKACEDIPEEHPAARERAFRACWFNGIWMAHINPAGIIRSSPWDGLGRKGAKIDRFSFYDTVFNETAALLLEDTFANKNILSGIPECKQFINRYLPGVVLRSDDNGMPTNAELWNKIFECGDFRPYIEVARAYPDLDTREAGKHASVKGTSAENHPDEYQRITTKAGSRLWGIGFSSPGGNDVDTLKAAYPSQLMVRFDEVGKSLIYEALEFVPTVLPETLTKEDGVKFVVNNFVDGIKGHCSGEILNAYVNELMRMKIKGSSTTNNPMEVYMMSNAMHDMNARAEEEAGINVKSNVDPDAAVLFPVAEWIRYKYSCSHSVRFSIEKIKGARLCVFNFKRPHGDLPEEVAMGRNSAFLPLSKLGVASEDDDDGEVAVGSQACGGKIEPLAVLVFEMENEGGNINPSFARTQIFPPKTGREFTAREKVDDWTPNEIFSKATRHYIIGDVSEMKELANFLCSKSPHINGLFDQFPSTFTSDNTNVSSTKPMMTTTSSKKVTSATLQKKNSTKKNAVSNSLLGSIKLLHPKKTSDIVLDKVTGSSSSPTKPPPAKKLKTTKVPEQSFQTKKEVHEFLQRCGVTDPQRANACLKAALLNGKLAVPKELLHAKDASSYLNTEIFTAPCYCCGDGSYVCRVRHIIHQDNGGTDVVDWEDDHPFYCNSCEKSAYVSLLCYGEPQFVSEKSHNHCNKCPAFGECIGDYRERHCNSCGKHYYGGAGGIFNCIGCGRSSNDAEQFDSNVEKGPSSKTTLLNNPNLLQWNGLLKLNENIVIPNLDEERDKLRKTIQNNERFSNEISEEEINNLPLCELREEMKSIIFYGVRW